MNGRTANAVRVVTTPARPGARLLRACAMFGLAVRRGRSTHERDADAGARALDRDARAGALTLIVGPSGSGKSTLLRALARRLRRRGSVVIRACAIGRPRASCTLIDLVRGTLVARLRTLGAAGLTEAALLARPVGELSEGERARAALALAMARAARVRRATVIVDEFTSGLDGGTARGLVCTLARWCERHPRVRVIAASSREELAGWCAVGGSCALAGGSEKGPVFQGLAGRCAPGNRRAPEAGEEGVREQRRVMRGVG